ncbi:MAG TPA: hypothetical protein VEK76_10100 [Candidatus Binatia bacterium]|nr:hypothetical protein [Candidatus Binatia bacterium]
MTANSLLAGLLCCCAGAFFHMSVLHFFCFSQTASHPMVRMWPRPHLASAVWGCLQLIAAVLILVLLSPKLGLDPDTFLLVAGFCSWGLLVAAVSGDDQPRAVGMHEAAD